MDTPTREALRDRLLDADRAQALPVTGRHDAAVLVPLYADARRGLVVVLTERRADLRRHAGEVAFPGGRRDPGEDLVTTALREAEEEIGLGREHVDVVGALAPVGTLVTGFRVYPLVGVIEAGHTWVPERGEVARVLELPLAGLRDGRRFRPLVRQGMPVPTVHYVLDGHLVWGATARMLHQLLGRLAPLL